MQEKKEDLSAFPQRLRYALARKSLKQKEFAQQLGISKNYLSALINGKKSTKKVSLLSEMAIILEVSVPWLLGEDNSPVFRYSTDGGEEDMEKRWEEERAKQEEVQAQVKLDMLILELDTLLEQLSDESFHEISAIVGDGASWPQLFGPVSNEGHRRWLLLQEKD